MRKLKIVLMVFLLLANVFVVHLLLKRNWDSYYLLVQSVVDKVRPPKVKIFMTYYKPYHLPIKRHILIPIQVGRAIEHNPFMNGRLTHEDIVWLHRNMIGDDTGDNISNKNRSFDVLTAYYWVWKHYHEIGNPKYIGFYAHRKGLGFVSPFRLYDFDYGLKEEEICELLEKHGVATWIWYSSIMKDNKEVRSSVYDAYKYYHNIDDLEKMLRIMEQKYPEMAKVSDEVLHGDKPQAVWNYFVMKKELAFDYFEKLFDVMFELEKELGDEINRRGFYQRRVYGYLAERFFAIWLEWQKQQGKVDPYEAQLIYY